MSKYDDLAQALEAMKEEKDIPKELMDKMKLFVKEEKPDVRLKETWTHAFPPKLPVFSGKDKPGNGETSYDLWKYELTCLIQDKVHSKELITQSVRRSLKGDAGKVLMRLGPNVDLGQIIAHMDSVFGVVEEKESIMREFYNASQKEDENITSWSFRLEDIIEKAIQKKEIGRATANSMLHDMLWKGLRPELKAITHYEKEKYTSYEDLRVALRRIEKDNILDKPPQPVKGMSKKAISKKDQDEDEDDQDEVKGMLKAITTRLDRLETGQQRQHQYGQYQYAERGRPRFRGTFTGPRGNRGGSRGDFRHSNQYRQNYGGANQYRQNYGGANQYKQNYGGANQYRQNYGGATQENPQPGKKRVCHRCGQAGHLAVGCDNDKDQYRNLNEETSAPRGGQ